MQNGISQRGKKPTLLDLREKYGVAIVPLADSSGVAPSIIYSMLLSQPVERVNAVSVLKGLSNLIGVDFSLGDVDVPLL